VNDFGKPARLISRGLSRFQGGHRSRNLAKYGGEVFAQRRPRRAPFAADFLTRQDARSQEMVRDAHG
jgi:hypothetical protein